MSDDLKNYLNKKAKDQKNELKILKLERIIEKMRVANKKKDALIMNYKKKIERLLDQE